MTRALALAAVLGAAAAHAQYDYLSFKNLSDVQHPFQYYVDDRVANPGGLSIADVKAASERAWNKWNAVACAVPKSQSMGFTGTTVAQPSNPYDVFNVTPVFVTTQSDPYFSDAFTYDVAAVALPLQYAGVLQQCDIYLNGASRTFSTSAQPGGSALDVETVMVHEVGHCLGIDHNSSFAGSVMVASVLPGVAKRDLAPVDVDILCQRYPSAGQVLSPCPDGGGCGGALKCVTQNAQTGPAHRFCTRGCPTNMNFTCDLPLTCQASTSFTPMFDGACLRPGANTTQVGKPCQNVSECGSSVAFCQNPITSGSTGTVFWQGGHCTQSCATGQPPCPAGSACTNIAGTEVCLQSCRVGFADCRQGYTCAATSNGGVCAPRCETNGDCANGFACRACDGLCVQINSQTQPGDLCTTDDTCGFGQTCVTLSRSSSVRLCSSGCGAGCQQCPAGSTCHPVNTAGDQFFCLRNCTGTGTCPSPLQCANLTTGRACLPPCSTDFDCAVGTTCNLGECGNPMTDPDGGCGLLCTASDGGQPIGPRPRDAGTGGGGSAGCGCNSSPESLLFGLMGLFLLSSRSRPWRRRQ